MVSSKMKSNLDPLAARRSSKPSMVWMRLPLTVQHTHPLFISTQSSSTTVSPFGLSVTNIFSTPMSAPNSFKITATLYPWSALSTWFTNVVFPAPKKPVTTVMPVRGMAARVRGASRGNTTAPHAARDDTPAARPASRRTNHRARALDVGARVREGN